MRCQRGKPTTFLVLSIPFLYYEQNETPKIVFSPLFPFEDSRYPLTFFAVLRSLRIVYKHLSKYSRNFYNFPNAHHDNEGATIERSQWGSLHTNEILLCRLPSRRLGSFSLKRDQTGVDRIFFLFIQVSIGARNPIRGVT